LLSFTTLKQIAKSQYLLEHSPMLTSQIKSKAKELGFDLVAFSPAKMEEKYLATYESWLKEGHEADMAYMQKIERRRDLTKTLPGAKTVIVLAMNYYRDQPPLAPGQGRVARYAYGRDYHKIIGKKLRELERWILEKSLEARAKSYVDTGPILERALAEQSGLGVIGKNGCLITREYGSWVFLSEIITTLDLTPDQPSPNYNAKSVCANCTRCIDACPTGAIVAPGVVDSRLCISYLTIEHRDSIPPELAAKITETQRIYGCDICQEVCPHNSARQKPTAHGELTTPKIAGDQLSPTDIQKTDQDFLARFAGSPFMRIKKEGLSRNLNLL
jgi:epoxyqueuosine reductase